MIAHIQFNKDKQMWHLVINNSSMMNDIGSKILDSYYLKIEDALKEIENQEDKIILHEQE